MKLDAWLRQDHPLAERLLVVECLSHAVNEAHERGEPLVALQPENVELVAGGRCDPSDARAGRPRPGYLAPERADGGPASAEAGIYAAGALAWEVLAGSPCGPAPTHLSEACPELPQELADAVMACLEHSPQWRPRDLSYLAQLSAQAGATQKGGSAHAAAARATPAPRPKSARATRVAGDRSGDDGSTTRMRLAIGAVLALAATGAAAYLWSGRSGAAPTQPATTMAAVPNALAGTPPPETHAAAPSSATPSAAPSPTIAVLAVPVASQSAAAAKPLPTPTVTPAAPATSDPAARVASAAAPVAPTAAASLPAGAPATPSSIAPAQPAATAPEPAPVQRAPLTLSAVSPLSARRPGKVMLDLRGAGMHDGVRVQVLPLRETPRGISILRQKCESDTLVRVLLQLDPQVAPGAYAVALEDTGGRQTKPLTFTVTR